jgi:uncharacterized membrane protein YhaH (DUF805 family)
MIDIKQIYFTFDGRIGRQTFWLYHVIPFFLLSGLLQTSAEYYTDKLVIYALFAINILLMIGMIAGFVKRLHDRGKSAWWLILILIPVIGIIYWIIDLGILRGEDKANEYGSPAVPPKGVIDA